MRPPVRAVGDDHVDRPEVERRRRRGRPVLMARGSFLKPDYLSQVIYCGSYSGEDPPLPIPNREVKLTIADGTAPPGGRVGSCRFYRAPDKRFLARGFFLSPPFTHSRALPSSSPSLRAQISCILFPASGFFLFPGTNQVLSVPGMTFRRF